MTASLLFCLSNKCEQVLGPYACFLCSTPCDSSHPTKQYVKDSFTGRDTVACPLSEYICTGCMLSFRETTTITIEGEERTGQRVRTYSWVIMYGEIPCAYTKAHVGILRGICLNPPRGSFAIVLADSGKKHFIYRAPVNFPYEGSMVDPEYIVSLEGEHIRYTTVTLTDRIELLEKLVLLCGKPGLKERFDYNKAGLIYGRYGTTDYLDSFIKVQHEPLTRLALWLARSKKELDHGNPDIDTGIVPAKSSGPTERDDYPDLFTGVCD